MAEGFLALRNARVEVGVKIIPHLAVEFAGAGKAANAAHLHGRIQRGEVAEFHCKARWRASKLACNFDDDGIAGVELAKAELVIDVERDEQFVARPSFARGHCTPG